MSESILRNVFANEIAAAAGAAEARQITARTFATNPNGAATSARSQSNSDKVAANAESQAPQKKGE